MAAMKTPAELANAIFTNTADHKRRATTLRRIAGGIEKELKAAQDTGLTLDDQKALQGAIVILSRLANACTKANDIALQRQEARTKLEKEVAQAMAGTFGALTTTRDRVALLAAIDSSPLRLGAILKMSDLDFWRQRRNRELSVSTGRAGGTGQNRPGRGGRGVGKVASGEGSHCHQTCGGDRSPGRQIVREGKAPREVTRPFPPATWPAVRGQTLPAPRRPPPSG